MIYERNLTDHIIAAAIEVHRTLGPGLLESTYEECLCREFELRTMRYERQKPLPLRYKGIQIIPAYRMDIVVDKKVLLELKCVEAIAPVHEAQILTYLRLSGIKIGLILNFHVPLMKHGIKRFML
ncbi:MAG TPA: GxxExxY protein [Acidobacteriota bacterium]|nr:GxxExxY protein [Acidobacteriota bacterium]